MCGIAGFLQRRALEEGAAATASRMGRAIAHRGPDHSGIWLDHQAGIALAHQRLSILDLSASGNQPMASESGRYVVTYNGEIYNFADLRTELGVGSHWRGTSDTEVLVAAIDRWGVSGALRRLNGMFAFATWDRRDRVLTLARDRMGEKPLFYGTCGQTFLFGSELKALRAHPNFDAHLNPDALRCMLRYDYVPAPLAIWRKIRKLPAAHYVEIADGGATVRAPVPFWSLERSAAEGISHRFSDTRQMEEDLQHLLSDSVASRMVSDVPLGAFLSGGVDSSLIVALMQAQSARPIRTFTIGFNEGRFDEAPKAKAVADHLGTDHTELYVSAQDALDVIPTLPRIWDEPFGDSSQIPTLLVSELSRQSVKVALSGDGADELFGGYDRFRSVEAIWRKVGHVPVGARNWLAHWLGLITRQPLIPGPIGRARRILQSQQAEQLYNWRVSRIEDPERLLRDRDSSGESCSVAFSPPPFIADAVEKMMYIDTLSYLPEDILTKVDRAAMAVSLEVRAPFLDHRVAELAWRLPASQKMAEGTGKRILRAIGSRYLPPEIMKQRKMGFSVPVAEWLRGPLRDWAESLLEGRRLSREGNLNVPAVHALWKDFCSGKPRHDRLIWNLLMFQAWFAEQ